MDRREGTTKSRECDRWGPGGAESHGKRGLIVFLPTMTFFSSGKEPQTFQRELEPEAPAGGTSLHATIAN